MYNTPTEKRSALGFSLTAPAVGRGRLTRFERLETMPQATKTKETAKDVSSDMLKDSFK